MYLYLTADKGNYKIVVCASPRQLLLASQRQFASTVMKSEELPFKNNS